MAYIPVMSYPEEGDLIAVGTSVASGGSNFVSVNVDWSNVYEGRVMLTYNNLTATLGVKFQVFPRYGTSVLVNGDDALVDVTLPLSNGARRSQIAVLPPGKYNLKVTNLDTSVSVTAGLTSARVTSLSP
jgi:hypothetical protein